MKHPTSAPILLIAAACVIGFTTATVHAQAPSYLAPPMPTTFKQEITVTATGDAVETKDIPLPTTVISRQEMDDAQKENVANLLRRVPGLTIMQSGDEGKVTSMFTRGTNSNQTLVMFDGVRLNSPYLGGYDLSLLTTSGLERIEVARGPYSALWGADAIGGVLNVVPRAGASGFNMNLFGEAGEDGWRRLDGDVILGGKSVNLYLSGLYREGDGPLENDEFETTQGMVNAGFNWGEASRLAVVYQDIDATTAIPFVTPDSPTPNRTQQNRQKLMAIPLRWALSKSWHLHITASEVEREFTFSDPDDPLGLTESTSNADTSSARLASNHYVGSHTFSWGGEWREDEVNVEGSLGVDLDRVTDEVTSAFLQDVWSVSEKVKLVLGVRWDDTETWGSEVSPRFHFGWQLSQAVELRAGYGQGFRQPSLGELYFPISGNPLLQPETSKSYELDFVVKPKSGKARWQVNLFSTEIEDLIEFDFIDYTNTNIGSAEIFGAELVVETALTADFYQLIQLTWLETEDSDGDPLLRRPEWTGAYTLTGSFWNRVRGDLTVMYLGARTDVDPVTFETVEVGGFATVDLAVAWQVFGELEVTARALNLLDRQYQEVTGYDAPRRRFMGGLRLRL
jgi:outer membrane cobalamin receptor